MRSSFDARGTFDSESGGNAASQEVVSGQFCSLVKKEKMLHFLEAFLMFSLFVFWVRVLY